MNQIHIHLVLTFYEGKINQIVSKVSFTKESIWIIFQNWERDKFPFINLCIIYRNDKLNSYKLITGIHEKIYR